MWKYRWDTVGAGAGNSETEEEPPCEPVGHGVITTGCEISRKWDFALKERPGTLRPGVGGAGRAGGCPAGLATYGRPG
jgi:hypothetical protein